MELFDSYDICERVDYLRVTLEFLRDRYVGMLLKLKDKDFAKHYKKKDAYVSLDKLVLELGGNKFLLKAVLRNCEFICKRPGSEGGYTFNASPGCLQAKVNKVISANAELRPIHWVRKYRVSVCTVLHPELEVYFKDVPDKYADKIFRFKELLYEKLETELFFEYDIGLFKSKYIFERN